MSFIFELGCTSQTAVLTLFFLFQQKRSGLEGAKKTQGIYQSDSVNDLKSHFLHIREKDLDFN